VNLKNQLVTLTDCIEAERPDENTDVVNYFFAFNGYNAYGSTAEGVQTELWNRYAEMYELYTIRSMEVRWIPFQPKTMAVNNDVKASLF